MQEECERGMQVKREKEQSYEWWKEKQEREIKGGKWSREIKKKKGIMMKKEKQLMKIKSRWW